MKEGHRQIVAAAFETILVGAQDRRGNKLTIIQSVWHKCM